MKKTFRKSVRIHGREVKSPRFARKFDADQWLEQMTRKKKFLRDGIQAPINDKITVSEYFDKTWHPNRCQRYPVSTTTMDRQRFDKYVRPMLGDIRVAKITQVQIRTMLKLVVEEYNNSISTRNRVRSLVSKLFNDAMNEEIPLIEVNPALNISFNDPRAGAKEPRHLRKEKDILNFIKSAKKLGQTHFVYATIMLMSGVRKQEVIALRWDDFDAANAELRIDEKFAQFENKVISGTKSGTDEGRIVPIPDELVKVLIAHKKKTRFSKDSDFILTTDTGSFIPARQISRINKAITEASGVDIHTHGLRHTYGRQFALKSGNMKALQAILGHSNSAVTEIYSKLAGRLVSKHRNTVSFDIGEDDDE